MIKESGFFLYNEHIFVLSLNIIAKQDDVDWHIDAHLMIDREIIFSINNDDVESNFFAIKLYTEFRSNKQKKKNTKIFFYF